MRIWICCCPEGRGPNSPALPDLLPGHLEKVVLRHLQAAGAKQAALCAANAREQDGYVAKQAALEADIAQVNNRGNKLSSTHWCSASAARMLAPVLLDLCCHLGPRHSPMSVHRQLHESYS